MLGWPRPLIRHTSLSHLLRWHRVYGSFPTTSRSTDCRTSVRAANTADVQLISRYEAPVDRDVHDKTLPPPPPPLLLLLRGETDRFTAATWSYVVKVSHITSHQFSSGSLGLPAGIAQRLPITDNKAEHCLS